MRRRRLRHWDDLADDPNTPYLIGRILGAHEMAVVLLREEGSPAARNVAEVLERVGSYFMSDRLGLHVTETTSTPFVTPEAQTEITPRR